MVNPAHEIAVGKLLEKHLPSVPYTLSHRINPSLREYRRASSTCFDASLRPVMGAYMASLDGRLREAGFKGRILIVTSQGGVIDADHAANAPGANSSTPAPAWRPWRRAPYGAEAGPEMLIVGDTGGTTFDVSPRPSRPHSAHARNLAGPALPQSDDRPALGRCAQHRGGWRFDRLGPIRAGLLHVGPQSAGALPGPACLPPRAGRSRP